MLFKNLKLFILFLSVSYFYSCANNDVEIIDPNASRTTEVEHIVAPGQTLALISEWYTGKAANWSLVSKYNNNIKPEKLRVGQLIKIPSELVIKSDPMPKVFPGVKKVKKVEDTVKNLEVPNDIQKTQAEKDIQAQVGTGSQKVDEVAKAGQDLNVQPPSEVQPVLNAPKIIDTPVEEKVDAETDKEKEKLLEELLKD